MSLSLSLFITRNQAPSVPLSVSVLPHPSSTRQLANAPPTYVEWYHSRLLSAPLHRDGPQATILHYLHSIRHFRPWTTSRQTSYGATAALHSDILTSSDPRHDLAKRCLESPVPTSLPCCFSLLRKCAVPAIFFAHHLFPAPSFLLLSNLRTFITSKGNGDMTTWRMASMPP